MKIKKNKNGYICKINNELVIAYFKNKIFITKDKKQTFTTFNVYDLDKEEFIKGYFNLISDNVAYNSALNFAKQIQ
jgi:hypothetical protein